MKTIGTYLSTNTYQPWAFCNKILGAIFILYFLKFLSVNNASMLYLIIVFFYLYPAVRKKILAIKQPIVLMHSLRRATNYNRVQLDSRI